MPINDLSIVQSFGLELPTPAAFFAMLVFSLVGWAAARHGKRTGQPRQRWLGWALMLFPYVVTRTWLLYTVGIVLCAALFV